MFDFLKEVTLKELVYIIIFVIIMSLTLVKLHDYFPDFVNIIYLLM